MGRPSVVTVIKAPLPSAPWWRAAELTLAVLLLVAAAPLLVVVAVLVRATSHGPVLHREATAGDAELLSFRTQVDGAGTEVHARLRAVVGAEDAYTSVGRRLERLRLDRLPRLVNVLRGEAALLSRS